MAKTPTKAKDKEKEKPKTTDFRETTSMTDRPSDAATLKEGELRG